MAYYIYLTENLINNKKYIGKHTGLLDDSYIGSGMLLKQAIEKHGVENFKKVILQIVDTEDELDKAEIEWISKFNAANDKNFYNLTDGGTGGNTLRRLPPDIVSKTRSGWFNKLSEEKKELVRQQRREHLAMLRSDPNIHAARNSALREYFNNLTVEDKSALYKNRSGGNAYQARAVKTPLGAFDTAKNAALAHDVVLQTVINRCNNPKFNDWTFL